MQTAITNQSHQTQAQPLTRLIPIFKSYRPLIIALVVIASASIINVSFMQRNQASGVAAIMNVIMGWFFITYGLPKFLNLKAFVDGFISYDVVTQRYRSYGYSYPIIEIILGLLYVLQYPASSTINNILLNLAVVAVTGLNVYGVSRALRRNKDFHCACLGSTFTMPLSKVTIIENTIMVAMAGLMLVFGQGMHM